VKALPTAQGKLADVFSALSGAPGLQNINLFRDIGLEGPLAPIYTAAAASICKLAKSSLQHLNLESTGAEGPIPPCLFGVGSQVVEVQLGTPSFGPEFQSRFPLFKVRYILATSIQDVTHLGQSI
jgi:hypothetical protein